MTEIPLAGSLPLWLTGEDGGVTYLATPMLDYVGCAELTTVDTRFVGSDLLGGLGEGLRRIVGSLPDGVYLHFVARADVGAARDAIREYGALCGGTPEGSAERAYVEGRVEWLGARAMRRQRVFLFFSQEASKVPRIRGQLGSGLVYSLPRSFTLKDHQEKVKALGQLRDALEARFRAIGAPLRQLTAEEVWGLHWRMLNPGRAEQPVPPRPAPYDNLHSEVAIKESGDWLREYTEAELLCNEDLYEAPKGGGWFLQGGVYRRVLTLKTWPEGATAYDDVGLVLRGMLDNGKPFPYTLTTTIAVQNQAWAKRRLNANHFIVEQLRDALPWRSKPSVEQEAAEAAQQGGIRALFAEMQERSLKLCSTSVSILIEAPSLEVLHRRTEAVRSAVQNLRTAQLQDEVITQLPAFLAMLPGAGPYQLRRKGGTSSNAADMVPIQAPFRGSSRAVSILETPEGDVVRFDPADASLNSHHAVIVADTGSGKSFSIGQFLLEARCAGSELVMIDDGWSWMNLTQMLGGIHLPLDLSTSVSPFVSYEDMLEGGDRPSDSAVAEVVRFIEVCVQDPTRGPFDNLERQVVSTAVQWCYAERFRQRPQERPLIGAFDEALGAYPWEHVDDRRIAEDLRRRLVIFTTGIFGSFLNRPSTLNFDAPVICFEMSRVGDERGIRAIAMATIIQAIWARSKRRGKRTIVAIDEMHKYLRPDDATGAYFEYAWRTMRKYGVSMWAATQDLGSLLRNESAKDAILTNSTLRFFLRHLDAGKLRTAVEHFRLPERAAAAFKGLDMKPGHYSDLMLMVGNATNVVRLQATPIAYWLLTTDPKDKALVERAQEKNPGIPKLTILRELAARYPHGAVGA